MNVRTHATLLAITLVLACSAPSHAGPPAAGRITDIGDVPGGIAAEGTVGDFLLENGDIAVVIDDVDHPHGDALSGGNILDAVAAPTSSDLLGQVATYLVAWPRQAVYDSVAIESDGASGPAVIVARGVDSENEAIAITTRYTLAADDRFLTIETAIANQGTLSVSGYVAGDAIDWGYTDNFVPAYGFDLDGTQTLCEWLGGASQLTSYAYVQASANIQATHGATWSDTRLFSGTLAPGATATMTRSFIVGPLGLSSASDVVHMIQGGNVGVVRAAVTAQTTGDPIPDAAINCSVNGTWLNTQMVTDTTGVATAVLSPYTYSFGVLADGYTEATQSAAVANGETTAIEFELRPLDIAPSDADTLTVVMRPILTVPTIVEDGGAFSIEAMAASSTSGWTASLARASESYPLELTESQYVDDRRRWFMTASVPYDVPEELYDLVVTAEGGLADTVAHAVAVRTSITDDFYFIHVTDTHLPTHRNWGQHGWDTDTTEMVDFRAVIDDINLANPAFVIHTGDLVNEGETENFMDHRAFSKSMRLLRELDVPVYLVAGNHDVGGWPELPPVAGTSRWAWWRFCGWRYLYNPPPGDDIYTQNYSFDYGGVHFTGLEAYDNYDRWRTGVYGRESFTARQLAWLDQDLSLADPTESRVLFYHYDFSHQLNLPALGVDCTLWGHTHATAGQTVSPPYNLNTAAVCDGARVYRVIHVVDGVIHPSQPVTAGANGLKMRVGYDVPNDGTATRITATVVNENNETFDDGLLRFHVRADSLPYAVDVGEIKRTAVDGDVATCYVHFPIAPESTTVVSIAPTEEEPILPPGVLALFKLGTPNPAYAGTEISFVLTLASRLETSLDVYDVAGRRVRQLLHGPVGEGEHTVAWDRRDDAGNRVASGIYFCRLVAGGEEHEKKLVVLK
jgi:hypothetical protein